MGGPLAHTEELTMHTRSMRRAVVSAAAAVLFAGTAQAALQDRDLNGDAVVDAFYDTDLDITWLRNANERPQGRAAPSPPPAGVKQSGRATFA